MSEVFRLTGIISTLCLLTCFSVQVRTLYPSKVRFSLLRLLAFVLVCAQIAVSLVLSLAGSHMGPALMRYMGLGLSIVGLLFCILSTLGRKKGLFQSLGIYRMSRNPFPLSVYLISIGNLLMFFAWFYYLVTVLTVFFVHLYTAITHEKLMYMLWGDLYADYAEHVRCYLGRR